MTLHTRAIEHAEAVIADAIRLMNVESPSADLGAVAASADAVADYLRERLGATPERIVIDGVTHVRLAFGSAARVVLIAHHDTVWPHGTLARMPAVVTDGILRGPGAVDMKTGIAIAVHALRLLDDLNGATLLVTGDEELGSATSRQLIEDTVRGASAALVLEAGGDAGQLKTQRKGTSMYRVTVQGRAAHAGLEPDAGVNAVVALAGIIAQVSALHGSEDGLTVVPSVVSGGTTTNTVPASAWVDVDIRATSVASQLRADAAMRSLTTDVPGATISVTGGPNRAPLEASSSAALFDMATTVAAAEGLQAPRPLAVGGASDGNITAGAGVPTLDGLGAWGGGAHADHEHAVVAGIPERVALLAGLVRAILSGSDEQ